MKSTKSIIQQKKAMNKKTDKANLEKSKSLFFATGFAVVLLLVLLIIEHKTPVMNEQYSSTFIGDPEFMQRIVIIDKNIEKPKPETLNISKKEKENSHTKANNNTLSISKKSQSVNSKLTGEKAKKLTGKLRKGLTQPPQFPGGDKALNKYLQNHLKYPPKAKRDSIQGRVYIQFNVQADGKISHTKVINSSNKILNAEALRLIKTMPRWQAARLNGQPAASRKMACVVFKL